MGSPICAISLRASTCVLLRTYCVPPRVTSEPSVPLQHVIVRVDVFVLESLAFPPDVPSSIAPDCAFWFPGWMVTVALPDAELFACETALTVTVVATLPPMPLDFVGTPLGATYNPLVDMNPIVWLPPAMLLTCQSTAVFGVPVTVAVNCCVLPTATLAAVGATEIVMVVLLDVPAQPENKTAAQPRLRNKGRRMKILTGGAGDPI